MHLYERGATTACSDLNGQWAFAMWDRPAPAAVHVARPTRRAAALLHRRWRRALFASEIKALFDLPRRVPRHRSGPRPDVHVLVSAGPADGVRGRPELPPAHVARPSRRAIGVRRIWRRRLLAQPPRERSERRTGSGRATASSSRMPRAFACGLTCRSAPISAAVSTRR